ncbi:MAG: hypothetical protein FJW40_18650 [Acidobacteria bacterium]|nr:hypothetical protein [Acidobacteriota bacterium]
MRQIMMLLGLTAGALSGQQTRQLTTEEIKQAHEKGGFFFLDVREPKELEELGTLKGYVNIPLSQLEARMKEIPKESKVVTV